MLAKVAQHLVEGVPQVVDVQAVEARFLPVRAAVVVLAEPLGQVNDLVVGPHPGRPALEVVQHIAGAVAGVGVALQVAVDPIAVGPVALHRDEGEALLLDQPLAQHGMPGVILIGAVRGLAQEDVTGARKAVQQRVEVGGRPQRPGQRSDGGQQLGLYGRLRVSQVSVSSGYHFFLLCISQPSSADPPTPSGRGSDRSRGRSGAPRRQGRAKQARRTRPR